LEIRDHSYYANEELAKFWAEPLGKLLLETSTRKKVPSVKFWNVTYCMNMFLVFFLPELGYRILCFPSPLRWERV
jgi:hypothetical protein